MLFKKQQPTPLFCKDCVWSEEIGATNYCFNPYVIANSPYALAGGKARRESAGVRCDHERGNSSYGAKCGQKGRLFKVGERHENHYHIETLYQIAREALAEFRQQDEYLLSPDASLMSEDCHEIIHLDTLQRIVDAIEAAMRRKLGELPL